MPTLISGTDLALWVAHCVEQVEAIDVHTHLLPPTHGNLLLYGIDELLCYHYLVAELFMILPIESELDTVHVEPSGRPPSPDEFFSWPKSRQADLVFDELFVKRTPISEACRGVVTALNLLGLGEQLLAAARAGDAAPGERLTPLRAWFAQQDPASYLVRYRLLRLLSLLTSQLFTHSLHTLPLTHSPSHPSLHTLSFTLSSPPPSCSHLLRSTSSQPPSSNTPS
jgi:hypothetical protein